MKYSIAAIALLCTQFLFAQEPILVSDYNPGEAGFVDDWDWKGAALDDKLILSVTNPEHGVEVGIYENGSLTLLKDINEGSLDSYPKDFIAYKGRVYFAAANEDVGNAIWVTDGTAEGTQIFSDSPGTSSSSTSFLISDDNTLYFYSGGILFSTDGVDVTEYSANVGISTTSGIFRNLCKYNGGIAFLDNDYNLFSISDGSIEDLGIVPGGFLSLANGMAEVETGIIIRIKDSFDEDIEGDYLFRTSDSTLEKVKIDGAPITIMSILPNKNLLIYVSGSGYFHFDGNPGTEVKLTASLDAITSQGEAIIASAFDGKYLFVAKTGWFEEGLYLTDGTAGNTTKLIDIESHNSNMVVSANICYFATGTSNGFDPTLYTINMIDGTVNTLKDFDEPSNQLKSILINGVIANDLVYASNLDQSVGRELYRLELISNVSYEDLEEDLDLVGLADGFLVRSENINETIATIYSHDGAMVLRRKVRSNAPIQVDLHGSYIVSLELEGSVTSKLIFWK